MDNDTFDKEMDEFKNNLFSPFIEYKINDNNTFTKEQTVTILENALDDTDGSKIKVKLDSGCAEITKTLGGNSEFYKFEPVDKNLQISKTKSRI